MSIHDGHRQRRKALFRTHGLDAFADHEILEMLLFYAVPRQDTNAIAHRLIEHFGSLNAVFSASIDELEQVEGVGESAATLIAMQLPLSRRLRLNSTVRPTILNSPERAGAYFLELFFGETKEVLYAACLDAKGKLLVCRRIADGGVDVLGVNIRTIAEAAIAAHASSIVLAHNHPSGIALASKEDIDATLYAVEALGRLGINVADHIIVADGDFVSLRDSGHIR